MNFTSVVMISNSVEPFTTTFSAHFALAQSFPHAVHQVLSLHSPAYSIVLSFVDPVGDAIMWMLLPCSFSAESVVVF